MLRNPVTWLGDCVFNPAMDLAQETLAACSITTRRLTRISEKNCTLTPVWRELTMNPGKSICAFMLLAAFSLQGLAQGVTEAEARTLLAEMDKAIPRKDIDAIAGALSDNVVLEITLVVGGQSQSVTYDKTEYVKGLQDSWAQVTDYQYQRNNQTIVVSGQTATATAQVVESFVLQGQGFTSRTREVTTIERVNGAPLITKVVGTTSMEPTVRM